MATIPLVGTRWRRKARIGGFYVVVAVHEGGPSDTWTIELEPGFGQKGRKVTLSPSGFKAKFEKI